MGEIFFRKFGAGKPVLLIHGFCETHEIWNGLAESLATACEVFAIDLPGFGQSQLLPTPFSIADISEMILDWMNEKKISLPFVVGHSLGGYVALAMAGRAPGKISGLCLFHSTPYPDADDRKINRNRVIEFVKANGVAPFVDTFVPGLFFDKKHAGIPIVDKIARRTSQKTLLAYAVAMRDRPSSVDFLKTFEKPVLVLAGEQDSIIPIESVREYGVLAKCSEVRILSDTGHMAMFEQPVTVQNLLAGFISGV